MTVRHLLKFNRAGTLAALVLLTTATSAAATPQPAPAGGPLAQFSAHNPNNNRAMTHRLWHSVLEAVRGRENAYGKRSLNYGAIDEQGRAMLANHLDILQTVAVSSMNRDEQLAYWLNLYNAASLKYTLDEFARLAERRSGAPSIDPKGSAKLRVKKFYLGRKSPWAEPNLNVEGTALSLNDIEHRILYAYWDSPLVTYGLSCPAKGCPAFPTEAFMGARVHQQLEAAARSFLADDRNLDVDGSTADVSQLYEWHGARLGGEAGIIAHLQAYAPQASAVTRIDDYDFSWRLEGTPPAPDWGMPKGPVARGAPSNPVGGRVN